MPSKKKGGKKKKKGPKLNPQEKEWAKLDKELVEYKANRTQYWAFLRFIDKWLKEHEKGLLFCAAYYDPGAKQEVIPYNEFTAILVDIGCPITPLQRHILFRTFGTQDGSSGSVNYVEMSKGMGDLMHEEQEAEHAAHTASAVYPPARLETIPQCTNCDMRVMEPAHPARPRYVQVVFWFLAFFPKMQNHPWHFITVTQSDTSMFHLRRIIREKTGLHSNTIYIFKQPPRGAEDALEDAVTFEDLGYSGGSSEYPNIVEMYYDFSVEYRDCPLLLAETGRWKDDGKISADAEARTSDLSADSEPVFRDKVVGRQSVCLLGTVPKTEEAGQPDGLTHLPTICAIQHRTSMMSAPELLVSAPGISERLQEELQRMNLLHSSQMTCTHVDSVSLSSHGLPDLTEKSAISQKPPRGPLTSAYEGTGSSLRPMSSLAPTTRHGSALSVKSAIGGSRPSSRPGSATLRSAKRNTIHDTTLHAHPLPQMPTLSAETGSVAG